MGADRPWPYTLCNGLAAGLGNSNIKGLNRIAKPTTGPVRCGFKLLQHLTAGEPFGGLKQSGGAAQGAGECPQFKTISRPKSICMELYEKRRQAASAAGRALPIITNWPRTVIRARASEGEQI